MNREGLQQKLKTLIENETKQEVSDPDEELDIDSFTMMLIITFADEQGAALNMESLDFDAFKSLKVLVDLIMENIHA